MKKHLDRLWQYTINTLLFFILWNKWIKITKDRPFYWLIFLWNKISGSDFWMFQLRYSSVGEQVLKCKCVSCQVDFITKNLCTEAGRTTASARFPALMQPSVTSAARFSKLSLKASRWPSYYLPLTQTPLKTELLLCYSFASSIEKKIYFYFDEMHWQYKKTPGAWYAANI